MFVENSFCQHIGSIAIVNIAMKIHRIKAKSVIKIIRRRRKRSRMISTDMSLKLVKNNTTQLFKQYWTHSSVIIRANKSDKTSPKQPNPLMFVYSTDLQYTQTHSVFRMIIYVHHRLILSSGFPFFSFSLSYISPSQLSLA